jgi:hypothetical protein
MNGHPALLLTIGAVVGLSVGMTLGAVATAVESPQVALWLEIAHRLCTSIGGLGTFAAMIFVVRQFQLLRSQTELLQKNVVASMENSLYSRLDSFNRFIVEQHKVYDLLNTPYDEQEAPDQRAKLHHLCDLGFTFYEEIYKHYTRYKILDSEDWTEWNANMQHFFGKPYVRGYWRQVSMRYTRGFQKFVDEMYGGLVAASHIVAQNPRSTGS